MTPGERIQAGRARPWLPASAFGSGVAEPALGRAVGRWASAWFKTGGLKVCGKLRPWDGRGQGWRIAPDGIALPDSGETSLRIAELLLGADLSGGKLKQSDRTLIQELARRCLDQLGSDLAKACGGSPPSEWHGGNPQEFGDTWSLDVGLASGQPLVTVLIASDLLVGLIRKAAPPDGEQAALAAPAAGADRHEVVVAAFLGRCRLSLADLSSLESGDVLCLDARTSEPVALAVDDIRSSTACMIEQDHADLKLRLVE